MLKSLQYSCITLIARQPLAVLHGHTSADNLVKAHNFSELFILDHCTAMYPSRTIEGQTCSTTTWLRQSAI